MTKYKAGVQGTTAFSVFVLLNKQREGEDQYAIYPRNKWTEGDG